MVFLRRRFRSERALRGWAIALLVVNCTMVLSGGLLRLTGAQAWCPTWPRCTPGLFTIDAHPWVTVVLLLVAAGMMLAAQCHRDESGQRRPGMRTLSLLILLGVPAQASLGIILVLATLPPWWTVLHLWLSLVMIALSVQLVRRAHKLRPRVMPTVPVVLVRGIFVLTWLVVLLGTLVSIARWHTIAVLVMLVATLLAVFLLRSRAAIALLFAVLVQGTLGYLELTQATTGAQLAAAHMLLLAVVVALATNLTLSVRRRTGVPVPGQAQPAN